MSLGRVLIVEANPGALMVARNVLAREGFDVFTAWEEGEGFRSARAHAPDLLLLDGGLARHETLNAFARQRQAPLPVLLVAWKDRGELLLECVRGPQLSELILLRGYIEKPFVADRLVHAVHRALGRASSDSSMGARPSSSFSRPDEFITIEESIDDLGLPLDELRELKAFIGAPTQVEIMQPVPSLHPEARALARRINEALGRERIDEDTLARACAQALEAESPIERAIDRTIRIELDPQVELPGAPEPMLSAELGALTPDQIFQFAESLPIPVVCEIDRGTARVEVFFRDRMVVFARQENMREVFALGRFLVDRGLVEQQAIDRLLLAGESPEGLLGQRLLTEGLIESEELMAALQHQTAELVYEALQWRKGKIAIYQAPELPPEVETAGVAFPVAHLLLEGMRRLDESHRIIEELGGPKAIPSRTPLSDDELLETLPPTYRRVLAKVDGQHSVEELIEVTNRPVFDVWQALKELRGQRLVTVLETPILP